ncbi:complement factor B [Alligator sinensis]|uniref:Complement C2 n=1 Tax=Alligator sinensis TaxID=38654 RepID=A0A3Q0FSQ4_ALLSI|nr:complement factor B [Alligator sinensis]
MVPPLCALLLLILTSGSGAQPLLPAESPQCSGDVGIQGGNVSLSDGLRPGSLLTYLCPFGTYPYPQPSRLCQPSGHWTPLRTSSSTHNPTPTCRKMRCPPQLQFEHGTVGPRRTFYLVGSELTFECRDGYTLRGSALRRCLPTGRWDGEMPACDDGVPFSYDLPEDVRASFRASLLSVLGLVASSTSTDQNQPVLKTYSLERRLILSQDGVLHLYLLVDASKSVSEANFQVFKDCVKIMVDRIASFDVPVKFAIISYASKPIVIVPINGEEAGDADEVLERVENHMSKKAHGNRTGTNIHDALQEIYHWIIFQKEALSKTNKPDEWKKVRHAVILLTDGKFNMGGSPKHAVTKIEDVLEVKPDRNDYLDIYAFGVGQMDVEWEDLNAIASKKIGEQHAFKLNGPVELRTTLDTILDVKSIGEACGLGNHSEGATAQQMNPWHVVIRPERGESCRGSLVADRWVLTAAHCFNNVQDTELWRVNIGSTDIQIAQRFDHPQYNVRAKVDQGIPEFYDYDLSLLQLERPVHFSATIRPICLPCTKEANRALRKPARATCKDHEVELLRQARVPAQFISLDNERLSVHIKTNEMWAHCAEGAVQPGTLYAGKANVSDVVTQRFLCSGPESTGEPEASTCKGESGGSLFVEKKMRYFQVGVVSWGTYNPCAQSRPDNQGRMQRKPPPRRHHPRDFYLSLFQTQDWLREHLSPALHFLPPVPRGRAAVAAEGSCDPEAAPILGGQAEVADRGRWLRYICPEGKYPHPVALRTCRSNGMWSPLRDTQNRVVAKAECREEQSWRVGCGQMESWVGGQGGNGMYLQPLTSDLCPDPPEGHCPALGVPVGATVSGGGLRAEDEVQYRCRSGLTLLGSAHRTCLEDRTWSGTPPLCRTLTPGDSQKRRIRIEPGGTMNIYLLLDASDSIGTDNFTRSRDALSQLVEKVSSYGVFPHYSLITFASEPHVVISTQDARSADANWVREQLEGLKYTDHAYKAGTNTRAALEAVYHMLVQQEEEQLRHGPAPAPVVNSTRHVLIIMTDGEWGQTPGTHRSPPGLSRASLDPTGTPSPLAPPGPPQPHIGRDIHNPREDFLDIYVFGVGVMVHLENINELASKKPDERHVFYLRDLTDLQQAFHDMIDESETLSMCGLGWEFEKARDQQKNPWHVGITITRPGKGRETCKGALVSPYFVLTAAHCFTIDDKASWITVDLGDRSQPMTVERLHSHPMYKIGAKASAGIPEFYDYDVALVKLNKAARVGIDNGVRPICLPCTEGTTRALRQRHPDTTCKDHEQMLLNPGDVGAFFVNQHPHEGRQVLERKNVLVKYGDKRPACEADALKATIYRNVTRTDAVVTPRFLCSGGIDPYVDPNTCKGEALWEEGGNFRGVLLKWRPIPASLKTIQRLIDGRGREKGPILVGPTKTVADTSTPQVGVISWGVVDVCRGQKMQGKNRSPAYARDFHINLFTVLPWLREILADEDLGFL